MRKKLIAIFSVFALFSVAIPITAGAQDAPKNTVKKTAPKKVVAKKVVKTKAVKANVPAARMSK